MGVRAVDHEYVELLNRFEYHPPATGDTITAHQDVRQACVDAATVLVVTIPQGREASLAITKLEEAMFWANAAIARNQDPPH